jgi:large subunit ribosomal protein L3
MLSGLLGRKLGMTQIFTDNGDMIPVTVLEVGPAFVVQKKDLDNDGYEAVKLGFFLAKPGTRQKMKSAIKGILKKAGLENQVVTHFKEFRLDKGVELSVGQKVTCDFFKEGEKVDISGITKGRGFAGGMKRHNWSGQPKTHGSMMHRRPGGTGASADPSRILKGKTLPGQYGATQITIQNLIVRKVDAEKNLVLVEGAVPGFSSGVIEIKKTVKIKKVKAK